MLKERQQAKDDGDKFYTTGRPCKHGHQSKRHTRDGACYECHLIKCNKRYAENKPRLLAAAAERYKLNPDKYTAAIAARRAENPEAAKEIAKRSRQKNADKVRIQHSNYVKRRRKTDPVFAMTLRVRALINNGIRVHGFKKTSSTAKMLGCTYQEFALHLERQFLKGMSWENRHLWHIDHITPLATAKTPEEIISLNHVSNLRPIWASQNMSKQDRIDFLI